jgi:hypothetical protein
MATSGKGSQTQNGSRSAWFCEPISKKAETIDGNKRRWFIHAVGCLFRAASMPTRQ